MYGNEKKTSNRTNRIEIAWSSSNILPNGIDQSRLGIKLPSTDIVCSIEVGK